MSERIRERVAAARAADLLELEQSKLRLIIVAGAELYFVVWFLWEDRKSTRLNSSHSQISYAVFCLNKKKDSTVNRYAAVAPAGFRVSLTGEQGALGIAVARYSRSMQLRQFTMLWSHTC